MLCYQFVFSPRKLHLKVNWRELRERQQTQKKKQNAKHVRNGGIVHLRFVYALKIYWTVEILLNGFKRGFPRLKVVCVRVCLKFWLVHYVLFAMIDQIFIN